MEKYTTEVEVAVDENIAMFPSECAIIPAAAKTYFRARGAAERIDKKQPPQILELTSLLQALSKSSDVVGDLSNLPEFRTSIIKAWDSQFQDTVKDSDTAKTNEFIGAYKVVYDKLNEDFTFSGDLDFLHKSPLPASFNATLKSREQWILRAASTRKVIKALATSPEAMPWADPTTPGTVKKLVSAHVEHERVEKEAARLLATLVSINTIIVTDKKHSAQASVTLKKYIEGRLSVHLADLPKIVQTAFEKWAGSTDVEGKVGESTEVLKPAGNMGKQKLKKLCIGKDKK